MRFYLRIAEMRAFYYSLLVTAFIASCEALNVDIQNKKIANAVCIKDSGAGTMELDLYIAFNGNQVDRVMALSGNTFIRNNDGSTNEASCVKTDITQGFTSITSRVSLSGTNDNNRCGARRITGTNNFIWVFEVRALYNLDVYVGIDRRYFITCIFDNAISTYATASINIIGDDLTGISQKISPVNTMSVLGQSATSGTFLVTDFVELNQNVKLQVASEVTTQPTTLDPYGVYPFSCDFGPLNKANRTFFIGTNGCPLAGNTFGLVNGYQFVQFLTSSTAGMRLFTTETDSFVMADDTTYPSNNFYYLSCYVNYCFGNAGSDPKCTNFCDDSRTGRKKRQDESVNLADLDQVSLVIRIIDNQGTTEVVNTEGETERKTSRLAIIVASATASVVFLIIVFIVVLLLCCRQGSCCGNRDDRLWEESSASTVSTKHQGHFVHPPPSIMPPKA